MVKRGTGLTEELFLFSVQMSGSSHKGLDPLHSMSEGCPRDVRTMSREKDGTKDEKILDNELDFNGKLVLEE